MKTVIFTRAQEDELYNGDNVVKALRQGDMVTWRIWYNGDKRVKPTKAEEGDRCFVLQEGMGIIASGVVGTVSFERGEARLSGCGMILIELVSDKVGKPLLAMEALAEVMACAKPSLNRAELVLEKKTDIFLLEELWMKAVIETNSCPKSVKKDVWKLDHLHELTAEALQHRLLTDHPACPCCGSSLSANDQLFYQPKMIKGAPEGVVSFEDLLAQYALLCKDCASIEKGL